MNSSANFLIKKISNERLYFSRFIEQTIQCFIRWFQSFVKKKNKEKVKLKVVQFMNYTVDKNESINLKTQRKRRVKKKVKEKKKEKSKQNKNI